jgi:hypothetical protein
MFIDGIHRDIFTITIITLLSRHKKGGGAMLILNTIFVFQCLKAVLLTSASTMKCSHSMGLVVSCPKCFSMERLEQGVQALWKV